MGEMWRNRDHKHCIHQGFFYTPLGGLTPPYFFLYTPDQSELVTPPWGGQVSDRCRGSTEHFVNRPNTVCWGDLMMLCTQPEKRALFPCFSLLVSKILLMPIGTAEVERSFSTMNRILRSERCRLLPEHENFY